MFSHCESTEEGTRNVVAECLGKLTLVDPLRLLPQLKVCVNSWALGSSGSVHPRPTGYCNSSRKRNFSRTLFKPVDTNAKRRRAVVRALLGIENQSSAHARVQHCCTNLAKRLQHHASSTNIALKTWPFSNLSQQHPTCRNSVAKTMLRYIVIA